MREPHGRFFQPNIKGIACGQKTQPAQIQVANGILDRLSGHAGLVTAAYDLAGSQLLYAYDADNNLIFKAALSYQYDALNRITYIPLTSSPGTTGGTNNFYDPDGNITKVVDATGKTTNYTYDDQRRLVSDGSTTYGYNLAGWVTSVIDAVGNTTAYAYNLDGLVTATTNPKGYASTYSYDHAGPITSSVDFDGRTTNYTYNQAGWVTTEVWVGGSHTATYAYDLDGELTAASDAAANYAFSYNDDGQLTQMQVSYPGVSGMGTTTLNYGYDGFGNRTSLSDSKGASITYSYDANFNFAGLAYTEGSKHANVTLGYNSTFADGGAADGLTAVTMSAGALTDSITATYSYSVEYSYLLSGYETDMDIDYSDSQSGALTGFDYYINEGGQLIQYEGPTGTSFTDSTLLYGYDASSQLTSVTDVGASSTVSYSYDANGNRNASGYTTPSNSGNEMTTDPAGDTLTYDHNGNLATKSYTTSGDSYVWTYTWDFRNRLTEVVETKNGSTVLTEDMTYDVFNNLIGESASGTSAVTVDHWTVYDGKNSYMDFDSSGNLTTHYLANPNATNEFYGRVAASGSNPVNWFITDLTGSVREIIAQDGTILDKINYDSFGKITYESSPTNGGRLKFQGGEYNADLKLNHFGDRWQDPVNGRWISQDPSGFGGQDANLYRFVGNNAISNVDASGDWAWLTFISSGLCAGFVIGQTQQTQTVPRAQLPPNATNLIFGLYYSPNGIHYYNENQSFSVFNGLLSGTSTSLITLPSPRNAALQANTSASIAGINITSNVDLNIANGVTNFNGDAEITIPGAFGVPGTVTGHYDTATGNGSAGFTSDLGNGNHFNAGWNQTGGRGDGYVGGTGTFLGIDYSGQLQFGNHQHLIPSAQISIPGNQIPLIGSLLPENSRVGIGIGPGGPTDPNNLNLGSHGIGGISITLPTGRR